MTVNLYKNILKPLMFKLDPEMVHDHITYLGETLGTSSLTRTLTKNLFCYANPVLSQKIAGQSFVNPVGLAAGFDYDGHLAKILPFVGFGYNTVGTVTAKPYEGNQPPRLGRLPLSRSLFVNKGFKSEGAIAIASRLDNKKLLPKSIGISVGSSNLPVVNTLKKAIDDYLFTFNLFKNKNYLKYFELNISCPNTLLPEPFKKTVNLKTLLYEINKLKIKVPIFIKMANEISSEDLDKLIDTGLKAGVTGVILSNLVKNRSNPYLNRNELKKFENLKGNFSGRPTYENSNKLITHTYKKYGKNLVIIGCGGIFNAQDAYKKIKAGASLVEMVTGMVFEGPQIIGKINQGLVQLLKEDEYDTLTEAIGKDIK